MPAIVQHDTPRLVDRYQQEPERTQTHPAQATSSEPRGDPLYHAHLHPDEYTVLLGGIAFEVVAHKVEDWETGAQGSTAIAPGA